MAQAVRDIRRRIKAVRSTQQITKAMQLVAAARLRKAQARAISARAYASKLNELLGRLVADGAHAGHALLADRPVRKAAVLVVTADRGLAGSFNTNLFRRTEARLAELSAGDRPARIELFVLGRKGRDYFRRRRRTIARDEVGVPDDDLAGLARSLSTGFIERFTRGEVDEIIVIYPKFLSTLVQRATELRLLPVVPPRTADTAPADRAGGDDLAGEPADEQDPDEKEDDAATAGNHAKRAAAVPAENPSELRYIYEPNARSVYAMLLPKFVTSQLYQTFLEARASEYAARMTAMASATDNADELIGKLTLEMHHARQASITQEIMELVGGAEALKER